MSNIVENLLEIDFEYNRSKDKKMNVVSVACKSNGEKRSFWLYNDHGHDVFRNYINSMKDKTMLAHNVVAESRSFISVGLNPLDFKWICTFTEQRCISNQNDNMMYGKQLIKGKPVVTHRKEWNEEPSTRTAKPEHSLAATTYKMLGGMVNLSNKDDTRSLIISAPDEFTEEEKKQILEYGESDIENLSKIYLAQLREYKRLLRKKFNFKQLYKEQLLRGENMARTAIMETVGYPINYKATRNFALSTDDIMSEIARDINEQFPDIKPFTYDPTLNRYKQDTKAIKAWIETTEFKKTWTRTKTGYSLAREEWEKRFGHGHTFIRGDFGNQMFRYYYTKQHMNGFQSTKGKKQTFWDSIGSDGRVRPWLNPYRAQSSRFQPSATGFIPLKAAWMRSLIQPEKGKLCAAIDYGSEEFLISGLVSGDKKMIAAYESGDVYLAFAKEASMVPIDATKASHPNERHIAKQVVLGISYGLTKYGLSVELKCSHEEAQEYIDKFNEVFYVFHEYMLSIIGEINTDEGYEEIDGSYQEDEHIKLPCGYYMWGDNDNMRSVGNCPIQGFGASIIRKAIALCQDAGLSVMYPLHDALYIELDNDNNLHQNLRLFREKMVEAFCFYFEGEIKEKAKMIRTDIEVWGFEEETIIQLDDEKILGETIHVDSRHENEYKQFKKYFEDDEVMGEL